MSDSNAGEAPTIPTFSMAEFLEAQPPGTHGIIPDFHTRLSTGGWTTAQPDLQLHCDTEVCNGPRIFRSTSDPGLATTTWRRFFLIYQCRNCNRTQKSYALLGRNTTGEAGELYKIGEFPPFGPPLPARVIRLIQPDRDNLLKGRRCENQGLGIGAFSYYRRVVESQWQRLLAEIIRVLEKVDPTSPAIGVLKQAAMETQFSKAVSTAKDAIPQVLLIDGHNPLTLLHQALSEGLHASSDEECLGLAQSIRVILTELADRATQALKDEAELRDAVSRLLNRPKST